MTAKLHPEHKLHLKIILEVAFDENNPAPEKKPSYLCTFNLWSDKPLGTVHIYKNTVPKYLFLIKRI